MSVGEGSLISGLSYLAVGRETTYGTYNTCTAGLDFLSCSLKTMKENKILEQVQRSRTFSNRMSLGKVVEGELEFYYQPRLDACNFMLQNFFGGTVTSATATGETTGAGASSAMTHTFLQGSMDQSYPSLCLNLRKGPSSSGKVFQYTGVRVDELMFSAELNEPLICKSAFVCRDSTQNSNDVESASAVPTTSVLSFVDGRMSVESSFASLTSTSIWHVQSVEFGWANSLKKDDDSRRIGSDVLSVCPPGMSQFTLNCKVRFDTTTAYDAMMNATQLACELEFLGPTLPGSSIRQGIKFQFPKVFISDAGDPEVAGPDEMLASQITFHVLRDDSSSTGYAVRALLTNQKTSYA
jgi:hypothetical protein